MPENGLAGAAALVTGASQGFGRGIATRPVPCGRPPLPSHAGRKVTVRATGGPSVATRCGHVRFVAGRAAAHAPHSTGSRQRQARPRGVPRPRRRVCLPPLPPRPAVPERPARQWPPTDDLTSSRPPLETVMAGLQRLCDLRTARDRPGLTTAHISLDTLSRIVDAG